MRAHADRGVFVGQNTQNARQHDRREGHETAKIKITGQALGKAFGILGQLLGMNQKVARRTVEAPPRRCQREALCVVANKKLHAEDIFKVGDGGRYRWLRDVTGRGSTRDAAGIRRRDEVTQVSERVVYY